LIPAEHPLYEFLTIIASQALITAVFSLTPRWLAPHVELLHLDAQLA
jgi:K+ transporter